MRKTIVMLAGALALCAQGAWYWPFGTDEDGTNAPPRLHRLLEPANDYIELAQDASLNGDADKALENYRLALGELDRVEAEHPDRAESSEFAPLRLRRAACTAAIDAIRFAQVNDNVRPVSVTDTTQLQKRWNKEHGIVDEEDEKVSAPQPQKKEEPQKQEQAEKKEQPEQKEEKAAEPQPTPPPEEKKEEPPKTETPPKEGAKSLDLLLPPEEKVIPPAPPKEEEKAVEPMPPKVEEKVAEPTPPKEEEKAAEPAPPKVEEKAVDPALPKVEEKVAEPTPPKEKVNPPALLPKDWEGRFAQAMKDLRAQDYAAADVLLESMLKERPKDLNALLLRAAAQAGTQSYYAAQRTLERAMRAHPRSYLPYYNLANLLLQQGGDREAAQEYYELGRTVGGPVNKALEARLKGDAR